MSLNTAGDLISFALRTSGVNGVGQTPTSEDANDSLVLLNGMLAQWQQRRWLVWSLTETAVVSTGAASYSVSPTGAFAIARQAKIESAFARLIPSASVSGTFINDGGVLTVIGSLLPTSPVGLSAGAYWNNGGVVSIIPGGGGGTGTAGSPGYIDFTLGIIESREDYNQIGLKGLSTFPAAVFYESAWPTGQLHFWPIPPAAQYELHVFTKAALPVYELTTPLNLPPEYTEALIYSLCVRLALNYGMDPRPGHVAAMKAALNTIRVANTQVSQLNMPAGVSGRRGGSGVAASGSIGFQTGGW